MFNIFKKKTRISLIVFFSIFLTFLFIKIGNFNKSIFQMDITVNLNPIIKNVLYYNISDVSAMFRPLPALSNSLASENKCIRDINEKTQPVQIAQKGYGFSIKIFFIDQKKASYCLKIIKKFLNEYENVLMNQNRIVKQRHQDREKINTFQQIATLEMGDVLESLRKNNQKIYLIDDNIYEKKTTIVIYLSILFISFVFIIVLDQLIFNKKNFLRKFRI